MLIDGLTLVEGSEIVNMTVASGPNFPLLANIGEVFYKTEDNIEGIQGLWVYNGTNWNNIAAANIPSSAVIQYGTSFPLDPVVGQVYYHTVDGLFYYGTQGWETIAQMVGTAGTYTSITTDDFGRVISGSTPTTLAGYGITDAASISHISDEAVHLTSAQNTWIDEITDNVYIDSNNLIFSTNGIEKLRIDTDGAIGIEGANFGAIGQVLTSNGTGASVSWSTPAINGTISTGTVAYFVSDSVPPGFLKANGAAISRTSYADLFAIIGTTYGVGDGSTTFKLPDLRGEFLRGFDDGRGVDSGRTLGSLQGSQNLSHAHTVGGWTGGINSNHNHYYTAPVHGGGNTTGYVSGTAGASIYANAVSGVGNQDHAHYLSATSAASGGTEARPRNIALLICIKY